MFFAAINTAHVRHRAARSWLDAAKPEGWGVTIETFLSTIRLSMNPQVMQHHELGVRQATRAVRTELAGPFPGAVVSAGMPDDAFLLRATGHRQVMDFYLVQSAASCGAKLATFDRGTLAAWPQHTNEVR